MRAAARILRDLAAEAAAHDRGRGGCVCPLCQIATNTPRPTS